jgi:hypothetical protein
MSSRPSGDPIQNAATAARAKGLRLLARMDFSKVSTEIVDKHPEW